MNDYLVCFIMWDETIKVPFPNDVILALPDLTKQTLELARVDLNRLFHEQRQDGCTFQGPVFTSITKLDPPQ